MITVRLVHWSRREWKILVWAVHGIFHSVLHMYISFHVYHFRQYRAVLNVFNSYSILLIHGYDWFFFNLSYLKLLLLLYNLSQFLETVANISYLCISKFTFHLFNFSHKNQLKIRFCLCFLKNKYLIIFSSIQKTVLEIAVPLVCLIFASISYHVNFFIKWIKLKITYIYIYIYIYIY